MWANRIKRVLGLIAMALSRNLNIIMQSVQRGVVILNFLYNISLLLKTDKTMLL